MRGINMFDSTQFINDGADRAQRYRQVDIDRARADRDEEDRRETNKLNRESTRQRMTISGNEEQRRGTSFNREISQDDAASEVMTDQAAQEGMFRTEQYDGDMMGPPVIGQDDAKRQRFAKMDPRAQQGLMDRQYNRGRQATQDGYAATNQRMREDEGTARLDALRTGLKSNAKLRQMYVGAMVKEGLVAPEDAQAGMFEDMDPDDIIAFRNVSKSYAERIKNQQASKQIATTKLAQFEELKKRQGGLTEQQQHQFAMAQQEAAAMEAGADLSPTQMLHDWMSQRPYRTTDPALEEGRNARKAVDTAKFKLAELHDTHKALLGALSKAMTSREREPINQEINSIKVQIRGIEEELSAAERNMLASKPAAPTNTPAVPVPAPVGQTSKPASTTTAPGVSKAAPPQDDAPSEDEADAAVQRAMSEAGAKWDTMSPDEQRKAVARQLRK